MAIELIAAATGAANSAAFKTTTTNSPPVSFVANGLGSSETVDIQVSHNGGTTWQDLYLDGTQVQLTSTNVMATLYGPGTYRASKGTTAAAVGVGASTSSNA